MVVVGQVMDINDGKHHLNTIYSEPHPNNFCGGSFQDWLEVNLLPNCNGKCSWCVERDGYHPKEKAGWDVIADKAIESGKTNIILLGGEPTLYADLDKIITDLNLRGRNVWVTTNGGLLTPRYVSSVLVGLTGINISIHDFDLDRNEEIVGVKIRNLKEVVDALHIIGVSVRLNCNCIAGHVDSYDSIRKYIAFAKSAGVDKIRLAELKLEEENFVNLTKVFNHRFGLNDDPFTYGCIRDVVIDDMPVNVRQMCGLQTARRPLPINPKQFPKTVLYYDGKFYDGWQQRRRKFDVKPRELDDVLKKVAAGKMTPDEAKKIINEEVVKDILEVEDEGGPLAGGGCRY